MNSPRFLALVAMCAAGLPGPLTAQQWSTGSGGTIYYNGGNVGIGTASPPGLLTLAGTTQQHHFVSAAYNHIAFWKDATPSYAAALGISSPPSGLTNGNLLFSTFTGSVWYDRMIILNTGNVGIGTATPQHLLHVAGTIGAEEVIVSSTGADYVFHRGYRLMPLSEVARYIDENHHLPGVPSSSEVKEKGVNLGEMQAKLLAKIEELTLHAIQEEKENRDLKRRIARLEASAGTGVPKEAQ